MQATARARYLRGSARKMRQVADLIRGRSVNDALRMLAVMPQAATVPLRKTVMSATANALASEGTAQLKAEDLRIARVFVDGGPVMKRIRPMGMGRAYRIRKPLCHLTVVVEGEHETEERTSTGRAPGRARAAGRPARRRPGTKQAAKKSPAGHRGKTAGRLSRKSAKRAGTSKEEG